MTPTKWFVGITAVLLLSFGLYVVAPVTRQAFTDYVNAREQKSTATVKQATAVAISPQRSEPTVTEKPEPLPDNRGTADAVAQPITRSKTVSLMPGQAFNVPNRRFRKIEIRSEYPLRVMTGPCHQDYTVEFVCDSEPADLFISDTRKPPVLMTPRANAVTITVTEF